MISFISFTVTVGCGATISENCTYFEASGLGSGECNTMLCPCSSNICQVIFYCTVTEREKKIKINSDI